MWWGHTSVILVLWRWKQVDWGFLACLAESMSNRCHERQCLQTMRWRVGEEDTGIGVTLASTCKHIKAYPEIHARACTRVHAHTLMGTLTHMQMHACTTHSHIHTHMHACTHALTHPHMHARTHTLTHPHTHACTHTRASLSHATEVGVGISQECSTPPVFQHKGLPVLNDHLLAEHKLGEGWSPPLQLTSSPQHLLTSAARETNRSVCSDHLKPLRWHSGSTEAVLIGSVVSPN